MVGFPYDVGPSAYQNALATANELTASFQALARDHAPELVETTPIEALVWKSPETPTETGLTIRFDHRLLPTLTSHIDGCLEQKYDADTVTKALQNP